MDSENSWISSAVTSLLSHVKYNLLSKLSNYEIKSLINIINIPI